MQDTMNEEQNGHTPRPQNGNAAYPQNGSASYGRNGSANYPQDGSMDQPQGLLMMIGPDGKQQKIPPHVQAAIEASINANKIRNTLQSSSQNLGPLKRAMANHESIYKYISWEDPARTLGTYIGLLGLICGLHFLSPTALILKMCATWLGGITLWTIRSSYFAHVLIITKTGVLLLSLVRRGTKGDLWGARTRPELYSKVPEPTLNATLKDIHDLIQFCVVEAQSIFLGGHLSKTLGAFLGCTALFWLTKIMSPFGLAVVGLHTLFAVPAALSPQGRDLAQHASDHVQKLANAGAIRAREAANAGYQQAVDISSKTPDALRYTATKAREHGGNLASGASRTAGNIYTGTTTRAANLASGTQQTVANAASDARDTAAHLASNTQQAAGVAYSGAVETASNLATGAEQMAGSAASGTQETASNLASGSRDAASNIASGTQEKASNLASGVQQTAGNAASTTGNAANSLGSKMQQIARKVVPRTGGASSEPVSPTTPISGAQQASGDMMSRSRGAPGGFLSSEAQRTFETAESKGRDIVGNTAHGPAPDTQRLAGDLAGPASVLPRKSDHSFQGTETKSTNTGPLPKPTSNVLGSSDTQCGTGANAPQHKITTAPATTTYLSPASTTYNPSSYENGHASVPSSFSSNPKEYQSGTDSIGVLPPIKPTDYSNGHTTSAQPGQMTNTTDRRPTSEEQSSSTQPTKASNTMAKGRRGTGGEEKDEERHKDKKFSFNPFRAPKAYREMEAQEMGKT